MRKKSVLQKKQPEDRFRYFAPQIHFYDLMPKNKQLTFHEPGSLHPVHHSTILNFIYHSS